MHSRTRTPPYIDHLFSIKIDNLPYRSNMCDVERYFKQFGKVGDIYIPRDTRTHESRGFAFVRYYDERDADDAVDAMDGALMGGREIRVATAKNGRPTNENGRQSGSRNYRDTRDSRDYRGGERNGSYYGRGRDSRDSYRDRRRSPPRRRRSHSHSRSKKKSRSRSPSPRYHKRSPSKSPQKTSKSPLQEQNGSQSRSQSRSNSPVDN